MGIMSTFLKRRRQAKAQYKAELKAAQLRAKEEAKASAKNEQRLQKLLAKQEKQLMKVENKGLKARRKHELKLAKAELEKVKNGRLNAATVTRYAGFVRTIAPLVLPLVYRAIVSARAAAQDRSRSQR